MSEIRRLVVEVDLDADGNSRRQQSFRAHLYAEFASGHRVVVLDDRGWSSCINVVSSNGPATAEDLAALDFWSGQTRDNLESTARMVVGPDEPYGDQTHAEAADGHWEYLAWQLDQRGVATDAATLRGLAMDVEPSERVLERLAPSAQP